MADTVLGLQRLAGNRTVAGLVRRAGVRAIARQPAPPAPSDRVVGTRNVATRWRAVAVIRVVGHASPRWRGAPTDQAKDENNERLAEQRAGWVALAVEMDLDRLLPGHQIRFVHDTQVVVDPLTDPSELSLTQQARGSHETLGEAGQRGRTANDPAMRRVEVSVTVHEGAETFVGEDVLHTEPKPAATTHWSIWVNGKSGVEAVGKAGAIMVTLRNEKTKETATYLGFYGGFGVAVGVDVAKAAPPDFDDFTTPQPMNFQDLDWARFSIGSVGASLGVGVEYAKFTWERFQNDLPTPDESIQVGGFSAGGVGLNLGSSITGDLVLQGDPSISYQETTKAKRTVTRPQSLPDEGTSHRVLFETGSATISPGQMGLLYGYLVGAVEPLRRNTGLPFGP
jgi:hypothetical protein